MSSIYFWGFALSSVVNVCDGPGAPNHIVGWSWSHKSIMVTVSADNIQAESPALLVTLQSVVGSNHSCNGGHYIKLMDWKLELLPHPNGED
jgi:hypothetical protein